MAAIGIFRGPALIFDHANEELHRLLANRGHDYIGVPLVEAFADSYQRPLQAILRLVYMTGVAREVELPIGDLWVIPLRDDGVTTAVATHLVVRSPARRLPAPPAAPGLLGPYVSPTRATR